MIQNVLRDIGGVGLYGAISVCLFFLVFGVALVRACLLKKAFLKSMSVLPLEDGVRPFPAPSPAAAMLPHSGALELSETIRARRVSAPGDGRTPAPTKGISDHE